MIETQVLSGLAELSSQGQYDILSHISIIIYDVHIYVQGCVRLITHTLLGKIPFIISEHFGVHADR